jgi:G patch domain-containing protein 1
MLDFFRNVAQTIPSESSPGTSQDGDVVPIEPMGSRDDSSKRAGIIVLREDLDFYTIPPRADITAEEMLEVKRATARALLNQDGIFSGLKKSDEPGTTEAHLIEMLTAGYVQNGRKPADWSILTRDAVVLTTTTNGATARASPTKLSFAAWP